MYHIPQLKVMISRTADGKNDYMQIISGDQFKVNVVLIADSIEIQDSRKPAKKRKPVPHA